jgi:hypothetical protein
MKIVLGIDRITIEPETDAERVLLIYWRDREGQKTSLEWDRFSDSVKGHTENTICLYINFDLIVEDEK